MRSKTVFFLVIFFYVNFCEASLNGHNHLEGRGKKKKIALFVYFADLIVKKLFILKLIYAFVLWCVIHKAGYFLAWFVSYLKEKKHDHHEHYVPHYDHGYHYDHGHYDHGPKYEYGPNYGPYRRGSWQ